MNQEVKQNISFIAIAICFMIMATKGYTNHLLSAIGIVLTAQYLWRN